MAIDSRLCRRGNHGPRGGRGPHDDHELRGEKALVSGPVAGKLLGRLDGTGVVGLGLTVGPLRRPFAAKAPLLGPDDWKGIKFRVFNSPVQGDAVRALGATPADLSFSFIDQLKAGTLRGAEFDISQYEHNGFATRSRARHRQRRAVAQGVRAGPQQEAVRRAHRPAAGLGARSGQAGRHGVGCCQLRPGCGGADAVRQGGPVRGRDAWPDPALRAKLRPCSRSSPRSPPTRSCCVTSRRSPTRIRARKSSTCRPVASMPSPLAGRWARFRRRSRPSPTVCTAGSSPSKTSPRWEETPAITRRASGRSRCGEEPTRRTVGLSRVRVKSAAEASRTSRSRSGICGEQARSSISSRMPRDCRV